MKLWQYFGKHIKITVFDGQVFSGIADYYESALDNPKGVASIAIGNIEFEETEIASIECVDVPSRELAVAM